MTDHTREAVADTQASLKAAVDAALMFGKPSIDCDTSGLRAILTALSNAEAERDAALARVGVLEGALQNLIKAADQPSSLIGYQIYIEEAVDEARSALPPAPTVKGEVEPVSRSCSWCGDPILPGEPIGRSDGEEMHLNCAAEEQDNATFDRDTGFD